MIVDCFLRLEFRLIMGKPYLFADWEVIGTITRKIYVTPEKWLLTHLEATVIIIT